ncbi:iron-sulfur cluster repair di-iron protein [Clostridium sp. 'White wine YQ']|uniref:iron-sulfur cluster repair di-iron protein n=1 Tax=Clostridium sp. 'White wine YQ' TaxID=3027474 RepID=UPI00236662F6|nr:iron-sulfur cluster repair di-iron protein [Clostridium sp. 'White wine YQ']MDD7795224.1 iron-sulfur cluster repair di-iron protein [Clostridium sp. 'White wine YQ']
MSRVINENLKLGEVVSIFPDSTKIFNDIKIDYCCGGHDSLGAALREKALNVDVFVDKLNEEYEKFKNSNSEYIDWREVDSIKLIENVVNTHHAYTFRSIKEIDELLLKILKVHFEHHSEELLKVHRLFGSLKVELEEHLIKEEKNLFPLMERYFIAKDENLRIEVKKYIEETEAEHDGAGDILKELEEVTRDFKAPEGACTTFKLVYNKLHDLEKDLFIHIYKENSILFQRV